MGRNRLYGLLAVSCIAGYGWLWYQLQYGTASGSICVFKYMTGLPCPSCGATRSVLSLLHGNFTAAQRWNPLGYLFAAVLLMVPVWLFTDVVFKRSSLYQAVQYAENIIKQKKNAFILLLIIAANWLWNIYKNV
ncbi:MAG TPA: DUF2752 domain-containing protein [Chitinophagales bacterium]|nr:DUF2752 domain-containing protein [Chitinophagales bacterium]